MKSQWSYLSDLLVKQSVLLGKTVVILRWWHFWSQTHVLVLTGWTVHRIFPRLGFEYMSLCGKKMKMSIIHGENWSYIWVKSSEHSVLVGLRACVTSWWVYIERKTLTQWKGCETSPGKKQGHFRSLGRKTTKSIPTVMMSLMTTSEEEHSCLNMWQIIHKNTQKRMRKLN